MPVTAPALNAILRPPSRLLEAASAVRTFACTETFMPMKPAAPESTAPMMKPTGICHVGQKAMPSRITTPTPTMAMVEYWRFK